MIDLKNHYLLLKNFCLCEIHNKYDVDYWKRQLEQVAEDVYGKNCIHLEEIKSLTYTSYPGPTVYVQKGDKRVRSNISYTSIARNRIFIKKLVTTYLIDVEKIINADSVGK